MKLLRCPPGLVATKIGKFDIYIDLVDQDERGYALVDDDLAQILTEREGFEITPLSEYPRSFHQLVHRSKLQLRRSGLQPGQAKQQISATAQVVTSAAVSVSSLCGVIRKTVQVINSQTNISRSIQEAIDCATAISKIRTKRIKSEFKITLRLRDRILRFFRRH